ncbi:MAG: hypothetical protein IPM34_06295 [Saprospiraceae bacterium]|nr:hypothetical protein [Saprospiraceae bacterium]
MQTNLLGRLAERGHAVYLISPDEKDPVMKSYCMEQHISLLRFQSRRFLWKTNYSLYRTYFLEDVRSNPALLEKHHYEVYRMKSRYFLLKYIPRVLMLIHGLFKKFSMLRNLYQKLEQFLLRDRSAINSIRQIAPDLVISTYPANIHEGVFLQNAKNLGIRTAIHLLSWDNITSKGRFYARADFFMAWGPLMKEELLQYYPLEPQQIYECGVPHFDLHHQIQSDPDRWRLIRETGINPEKPYLLFGMSSPRFVPYEIEIVEMLSALIEDQYFGPDLQMLVRPHPQNMQGGMADPSWLPRLQKLESKRIRIFYPLMVDSKMPWSMQTADMQKLAAVISGCLVCINSCSTLSIDALMAGKSNIAPMFDGKHHPPAWKSAKRLLEYIHIKKLVQNHGIEVACNENELNQLITEILKDPNSKYNKAIQAKMAECGETYGQATENVIRCIAKECGS